MAHRFPHERKHHLDSAERQRAMPVDDVLSSLPLKPDQVVADIGSGTGYFTLPLASKLPRGKVLAVDVSDDMLDTLRGKLSAAGSVNVELVKSEELLIPIAPGSLDGAMAACVWHETEDQTAFLNEVKRLLKPGAWLALVEWAKRPTPHGPPLAVRIDPAEARAMAGQAGFKVVLDKAIGSDFYLLLLENTR